MKYPEITRLFKFYAYNENSLSVLINKKIWFAKPGSLNDPFDCKIPFDYHINQNDLKDFLPRYQNFKGITDEQVLEEMKMIQDSTGQFDKEFVKIWDAVIKKADEQLSNSGVFCLSQCCTNILMWSHYANSHKGFCVEFIRNSDNCLGDYEKTRRVNYRTDFPAVSPLSSEAFDLKFFSKATNWKYEKEWRLINEEGNIEESLPGNISAIIFGLNMPAHHRTTLKNILFEEQKIEYRRAVKAEKKYQIEIENDS